MNVMHDIQNEIMLCPHLLFAILITREAFLSAGSCNAGILAIRCSTKGHARSLVNALVCRFTALGRLETSVVLMVSMWMCERIHMPAGPLVTDLRLW